MKKAQSARSQNSLTEKQIAYIKKNYQIKTTEEIASFLKIDVAIVEKYISENLQKKIPFYFYVILALLPLLVLATIEIFLRLINFGDDYSKWIEIDDRFEMAHPDIAKKYFYRLQALPNHSQDPFFKEKKDDIFRIFIFGESSAAGFPYLPHGGFHRRLRDFLSVAYPDKKFEIINLGISAISSYVWLDLYKDVCERKPDLIIFYGGHNEYYGALAVASAETIGNNRFFIKLYLSLINFRLVQLIRDGIASLVRLAYPDNNSNDQTLMAVIAREKLISKNSKLYYAGLEQFENNMKEMLYYIRKHKIPVILCSIASNLKDQSPFESIDQDTSTSANYLYRKARDFYSQGLYKTADSLFRLAKDYDALRFRAPEDVNRAIAKLAKDYDCFLVDVDSLLSISCVGKIIGDEVMTDHLHPNEKGYHIIAKGLFEIIGKEILKAAPVSKYSIAQLDSVVFNNFNFSYVDKKVSEITLLQLKSSYPFVKKNEQSKSNLRLTNKLDSLAYKFRIKAIQWDKMRIEAANYYLAKGDTLNFIKEYKILTDQYPYIAFYYKYPIEVCVLNQKYETALEFLSKYNYYVPDAYSYKWTGSIYLSQKKYSLAVRYLEQSVKLKSDDYQSWHNLAGAYYYVDEIDKAIYAAEQALKLNPNEENTKLFLSQVKELKKYRESKNLK